MIWVAAYLYFVGVVGWFVIAEAAGGVGGRLTSLASAALFPLFPIIFPIVALTERKRAKDGGPPKVRDPT